MSNFATYWRLSVELAKDIGSKFVNFFENFATETVLDWAEDLGLIATEFMPDWLLSWLDVPWISVLLIFGLTAYPLYQLAKWTVGIITGA